MNIELALMLAGAVALLFAAGAGLRFTSRSREQRDHQRLVTAREEGMHLPPSLHPLIDPDICIGSLACVTACPEGDVLGIVGGVGRLVVGANCIGHGRCAAECPVGAIKLVFGTSERGVDIPRVSPFFESTVPGIYIAGELGGMGLIRNAARQGVSVIGHLAGQLASERNGDADDVVIVGGGPAGLAAALAARQRNLRFRLIEQDAFGGTVVHYPRQKLVMTEEVELPLAGTIPRGHVSKEDLLERFTAIRRRFELPIQESEPVTDLRREGNDFEVVTGRAVYPARKVVLCIGRRGQPRRLGVPGEDLSTVTYRLTDPEQYSGRSVLVVGGGDSAVEAACALAEAAATVSIVHRGQAFSRCKAANRERIAALAEAGRVQVHTGTVPIRFAPGSATVGPAGGETTEAPRTLAAEFVIVCAGGDLPATMLSRIGVEVDRHYGEPF